MVETEYSAPDLSSLVPTRLREGGTSNARGGSLCERDLLIMHAWAAPEIQTAWSGADGKRKRSSSSSGRGGSSSSSAPKAAPAAKRPRKRSAPRGEPKEPQPLPPGWREETRTPQSGRKYRVYLGPTQGLYAESRNKAWETYERLKRAENGEPEFEEPDEGTAGKKKGGRAGKRVCLACDFRRKRKCTCGKRARRW